MTHAERDEAFVTAVCDAVLALGGVEIDGPPRSFAVQTTAGRLEISPYPEFIACRFDDVERARRTVHVGRLNPHSGKWNFGHGELYGLTLAERPIVEACVLAEFSAALGSIVSSDPLDPPSGRPTIAGYFRAMLRAMRGQEAGR